jgi:hypothetical protein
MAQQMPQALSQWNVLFAAFREGQADTRYHNLIYMHIYYYHYSIYCALSPAERYEETSSPAGCHSSAKVASTAIWIPIRPGAMVLSSDDGSQLSAGGE